jgi:hypothetical protein
MPASPVDYEEILDIISEENCALFIGPGLLKDDNGQLLEDSMWKAIGASDENHRFIRHFYAEDGLVLLHEENMRRRLVRKIRGFYGEEQDHEEAVNILRKIARLPISLIFNLTKHNILGEAFEKENQPFHYDFYFKGHPHQPFITPAKDKPLIYNLLGDIEEPESIILTHKDLFDYLESIFTGNSMAPELRKLIQDTDFFIFLGLPFEKWYMQLLLRVLYHISSRLEKIEQFASLPDSENVNNIFEDEFKIQFMPDDGMTFMDGLFTLFEKEGMLKSVKEEGDRIDVIEILDQAKEAFSKDKMNRGFKAIEPVLQSHTPMTSEILNKFLAAKNYFYDLEKKEMDSIATSEDRVEMRKVVINLISMVDEIKALFS